MIISHRHRFIFIKTHKTAGTSMEVALAPFLGPEDVLAPDWPWGSDLRRGDGDIPPQHFWLPWSEHGPVAWARVLGRLVRRGELRRRYKFWNHMPARDIRRRVGDDTWHRYFKFTIERNPWDKVVSRYFWDERERRRPRPFERFVRSGRAKRKASDFPLYTLGGELAVDHVLFYERLEADAAELATRLELPASLDLRRERVNAKGSHRPRRGDYRTWFTPGLRKAVARQFRREIEAFGYAF